jgi:hypothetical protein
VIAKYQTTLTPRRGSVLPRTLPRVLVAGLCLILLLLIWYSGRAGFASLLASYAARVNQIAPANAAVHLNPSDPETHYTRGAVLEAADDFAGAISEYRTATMLRPDDHALWISLARVQELDGDIAGALSSARRALPLSPSYAQPHWQLGNLLVRAGELDEGFKELRLAEASNPVLLAGIVELAWQLHPGDVQFVKQAMQPQTPETYLALAENFRKHGRVEDAILMFSQTGVESLPVREQYLNELISAKRFKDAYALRSLGRSVNSIGGLGVITDPGFEQESNLEEPGFGWHAEKKAPSLSLAMDPADPQEGHSSLRVQFQGDSDPGQSIISQLVLLEPRTRYRLRFAARSENVVSGGLPSITVTDASDQVVLGHVVLLPQADSWQDYVIDFNSREATTAIRISLGRERCSNSPCPIFGRMWLDDFLLKAPRY